MKKNKSLKFVAFLLAAGMVLAGSGAFAAPAVSRDQLLRLSFGTSSLGGTFFGLGAALSTLWNANMHNVEFSPETTGGSAANYGLLEHGEIAVGMAVNTVADQGWKGKGFGVEEGVEMRDVRTIAGLFPSSLGIYVLESSNISTFDDLNGRIISGGPIGSGAHMVLQDVFNVLTEIEPVMQYAGLSDINGMVVDGMLDATVLFVAFPSATVLELESMAPVKSIEMSPEQIKRVTDVFPLYYEGTEPAGTYKSSPPDGYTSLMTPNLLMVRHDLDEDIVYAMVKLMFDNMDTLIKSSNVFSYVEEGTFANSAIPLHTGAIRYFQEKGYDIPDHLFPPEWTGPK